MVEIPEVLFQLYYTSYRVNITYLVSYVYFTYVILLVALACLIEFVVLKSLLCDEIVSLFPGAGSRIPYARRLA